MFHKLQSLFSRALSSSTSAAAAAAGRKPMPVANEHFVLRGRPLAPPFPEGHKTAAFGTGCFWGAERAFWSIPDVYSTAVGYIAGEGEHPTYEEVCSGATGHNEVVQVVYDPKLVDFYDILKTFWEFHDPTQGNRQGNDHGTQYRSGIYCSDDAQLAMAARTASQYAEALGASGRHSRITTEIVGPAQKHVFYYAEDYHQQYLAKPGSRQYCSAQPTGVDLPPLDQENGDGATETSNTP